jgi:glycosyltransferase involved in cell wall biosynthesis
MIRLPKIGIIMQSDSNWMGGILYTKNLVKALAKLPIEERKFEICLIIASDADPELFEELRTEVQVVRYENCLKPNIFNRFIWKLGKIFPALKDKRLEKIVSQENLDFLYPLLGNYGFSLDFHCRWAAWIPDFQHKYLPNFFSSKEIKSRDQIFSKISRTSPNIVFSSKSALKDFKNFYPDSSARNYVVSFSSFSESSWYDKDPVLVQKSYNLPDNFFLVSNQFWIHKNHRIIIEALKYLKEKLIYPVIVCTGKLTDHRFPGYGDDLLSLVDKYGLGNQFKCLGLIPRSDQIQLMRRSLALIQPSLFEGWSTVVEDARLLGKTIILSDISVHVEQNPPFAKFFIQDSHVDLAAIIEGLLPDLIPGPNIEFESQAQQEGELQVKIYAKNFTSMVLDEIYT